MVRYVKHRNDDDAVATTLQKVRADAAPIRGERWDRVRASSLRGGPGGVVDLFKDVGRPNHVTYADDVLRVELSTGADAARSCVTVTLRRDSTIYTTGRCTPGRD